MVVAKVNVSGAVAQLVYAKPITAGMVGAEVEIEYDGKLWDALIRTAVFECCCVTKDVFGVDEYAAIPPEVLQEPGRILRLGIYGTDAVNTLVIPTIWVELGKILDGADPSGDTDTNPELPGWAHLLDQAMGYAADAEKAKVSAEQSRAAAAESERNAKTSETNAGESERKASEAGTAALQAKETAVAACLATEEAARQAEVSGQVAFQAEQ